MSYIGNTPTSQAFAPGTDTFSGTGSQTAFTLSRNVSTVNDILVVVNNVEQQPSNYTVSGTTLTFSPAPSSGTNNIYVRYLSTNLQSIVPQAGSIVPGNFGIDGNLNFSGSARRITGDFSNATAANRVWIQSSTTNGETNLYIVPNGTSTQSGVAVFNASTLTNAAYFNASITSSSANLDSGKFGAGTYLPMTFYTSGSERMRVDTAGNVGIGTSSPSTYGKFAVVGSGFNGGNANFVSTSSGNSITVTGVNGASVNDVAYYSFTDGTNNAFIGLTGTNATAGALRFATGTSPTERMRIDSSGNVLVTSPAGLGYGTGSGGTVTQATNKGTPVTLNKPTGQITMNNAALAANTTIGFFLNNSVIAATDTLIVNLAYNAGIGDKYSVRASISGASAVIYVTNITGGSLSEAVVINFAIIKGATS